MKKLILTGLFLSGFSLPSHSSEAIEGAKKDIDRARTELSAQMEIAQKRLEELRVIAKEKGSKTQLKAIEAFEKALLVVLDNSYIVLYQHPDQRHQPVKKPGVKMLKTMKRLPCPMWR